VPSRALLTLLALVAVLSGGALLDSRPAAGQADLRSERAAAQRLRAAVAVEERRIGATRAGLADAQRRLDALAARVAERQRQLQAAQDRLVRARVRLSRLQRRALEARRTLAANLASGYKRGEPDLVTVVVSADGFEELLERFEFLKRVSRRNALVLDRTRELRAQVARQEKDLEGLRGRYSGLARAAIADRDRADVVRGALLARQARQLARRDGVATRLATVRTRIGRIERRQTMAARRASAAASAADEAPTSTAGSRSGPSAGGPPSGGGSGVVARVVAAANEISRTPYVYGGGHGGNSSGYDCSGSMSYALAAGGLLDSPLDSTGFMSYGEPGPGRRITTYANAGHAFMVIDGRRFDTTALSGGGTRWTSEPRSTAGFVARHPPGL